MTSVSTEGLTEAQQLLFDENRYDLVIVNLCYDWVCLRVDVDCGCWNNPGNRYPPALTPMDAAVNALLKDKAEGYIPTYGNKINEHLAKAKS